MFNSDFGGLKGRPFLRRVGLPPLFFSLLFLRRSAQLLHPQIWAEDGAIVLLDFIQNGWKSFAIPINGYLVTSSKLIMGISLMVSSLYTPLVGTLLAWLFIVGVCSAIAFCPTWLTSRPLIAIATLLVPCDPELFGIALYSFWWTSLLLFLVVLWDEKSSGVRRRIAFVILGGLSTPIIFLVTPFLALRVLLLKPRKSEGAVLGVAAICCFIQSFALHTSDAKGPLQLSTLRLVLPKFLGSYVAGNLHNVSDKTLWFAAGLVLAFLLATLPFIGTKIKYWFLLGLWLGAIFSSAARVDLSVIHPHFAGPRYFFLPFVLLSWFVVSVLSDCDSKSLKLASAAVLSAAVLNALPVLSRKHADFRWADHLVTSSRFDYYEVPFPLDGYDACYLYLNRAQSTMLQRWGLIDAQSFLAPKKTFPYRMIYVAPDALASLSKIDKQLASASSIVENSWRTTDCLRGDLPGFTVVGSLCTGDAAQGSLTLRLHRGDRVLFHAGPTEANQTISIQNAAGFLNDAPVAPTWMLLEFSNDLLPSDFTVIFSDHRSSLGQFSAAGLRSTK